MIAHICFSLALIASLVGFVHNFDFKEVTVSASSYTIRNSATFTFILERDIDNQPAATNWDTEIVQNGSTITIQFPSEYPTQNLQLTTLSSLSINNVAVTNFIINRAVRTFTVSNAINSPSYIRLVRMVLANIKNPEPAIKTSNFVATIGIDKAAPRQSNPRSFVELTEGALTSCSATFVQGFVNRTDILTIQLSSMSLMNPTNIIKIDFPNRYRRQYGNQTTGIRQSTSCSTQLDTYGISCSGSVSTISTVTVNNAFPANISYSTTFQIHNILVPSTIEPIDTIKILTLTSSGTSYDSCNIIFTNIIPLPLNPLTYTSAQIININKNVALNFSFPLSTALYANLDYIVFTISSSYSPLYEIRTIVGEQSIASSNFSRVNFRLNTNSSNLFNITNLQTISTGAQLTINISNFIGSPSVGITTQVTISLYQAAYLKAAGSVTLQFASNSLDNILTTVSNPIVSSLSAYTISFTSKDFLPSTGKIKILFPTQIPLQTSITQATINGNNAIFTLLSSQNGIELSNIPTIPSRSNVVVQLNSIYNPSTTDSIDSAFMVYTYYSLSDSDLVNQGTYIPSNIVYTGPENIQYTVSSSSSVTMTQNVSLNFTINTQVGNNAGSLEIYTYKIQSNLISTTCLFTSTNRTLTYPCAIALCKFNTTCIKITNLTIIYPSETFSLLVNGGFTNPPSTRPQAYFIIVSYSNSGKEIQRSSSITYLYLNITTPSTLKVFNVYRTSRRNSQISAYTFELQQRYTFLTSSQSVNKVIVSFPAEINLSNAVCLNCTIFPTNNSIIYHLNNILIANRTNLTLTATQLQNSPSFQPLSSLITARTLLIVGNLNYEYSLSNEINNYIQSINNEPSSLNLTSSSTKYTNFQYGQSNSLTVSVVNNNVNTYFYVVTLSTLFVPQSNLSCSIAIVNYTCTYNVSSSVLTINKTSNATLSPSNIQFTISGFTNPEGYPSSIVATEIRGFNINSYLVNQYIGNLLIWSPLCQFPCKTCQPTNTSACLTCFINQTFSSYPYYYRNGKICLSQCLSTQILIVSECKECSNICLKCSIVESNCTACNITSQYPYFFNNSCLRSTQCPTFYYPDSSYVCLRCVYPCLSCISQVQCILCATDTYWYGTNCISTCPFQITIPNNLTKNCDSCHPSCATCSLITNNCTSCTAPLINFDGNCLSNCTPPLYKNVDKCIANCIFPCSTCQYEASLCLTCTVNSTTPYFLYSSGCQTSCPVKYVKNYTSFSCDSCTSMNINCSFCRQNLNCSIFGGSQTCPQIKYFSCYRCDDNFIYYYNQALEIHQCVTSLPDNYTNYNGIATACDSVCLKCNNLPGNCTYCSTLNYYNQLCQSICPTGFFSKSIEVIYLEQNKTTLICSLCENNCLTCLSSTLCLNCQNNTYYNGNFSCVTSQLCPLYSYANDTYRNCSLCASPCVSCASYLQCRTCVNSTYFYDKRCLNSCPLRYFKNQTMNRCDLCSLPCLTCSFTASRCLSCALNFYFYSYNFSCLADCPANFTQDFNEQICKNCTSPCLQCSETLCNKCKPENTTIYYLIQGICLQTCPLGYYQNNDTVLNNNTCSLCQVSCFSCANESFCYLCAQGYIQLQFGICVDDCPANKPVVKNVSGVRTCQPCSQANCILCLADDKCLRCQNYTFILLNGKCQINCPSNLRKITNISANISTCQPPTLQQLQAQIIIQGQTLVLPIKYPCSILAAALCFVSLLIKMYQFCCKNNKSVLLFALLSSAMALPEIAAKYLGAFAYFLLKYRIFFKGPSKMDYIIYIMFACIFMDICIGFYVVIVQTKMTNGDSVYLKWSHHANCAQKCYQYILNIITLLNFKISHGLWCGIKSLPLLETSHKLFFFNKPSGLSAIISLIYTILSILIIYLHYQKLAQIYYDIIIVVVISVFFSLIALRRPYDFFVHTLDESNDVPMNKRVVQSEQILIGSLKPNRHYDDDFYSKLKQNQFLSESLYHSVGEQPSSRMSALSHHQFSSQKQHKDLRNFSIQYSRIQSSQKSSSRDNEELRTSEIISDEVHPAGSQTMNQRNISLDAVAINVGRKRRHQAIQDEIDERMVQTNLGMIQIGQDQSYSAQLSQHEMVKHDILPKEFKANYYDDLIDYSLRNAQQQQPQESSFYLSQPQKNISIEISHEHSQMASYSYLLNSQTIKPQNKKIDQEKNQSEQLSNQSGLVRERRYNLSVLSVDVEIDQSKINRFSGYNKKGSNKESDDALQNEEFSMMNGSDEINSQQNELGSYQSSLQEQNEQNIQSEHEQILQQKNIQHNESEGKSNNKDIIHYKRAIRSDQLSLQNNESRIQSQHDVRNYKRLNKSNELSLQNNESGIQSSKSDIKSSQKALIHNESYIKGNKSLKSIHLESQISQKMKQSAKISSKSKFNNNSGLNKDSEQYISSDSQQQNPNKSQFSQKMIQSKISNKSKSSLNKNLSKQSMLESKSSNRSNKMQSSAKLSSKSKQQHSRSIEQNLQSIESKIFEEEQEGEIEQQEGNVEQQEQQYLKNQVKSQVQEHKRKKKVQQGNPYKKGNSKSKVIYAEPDKFAILKSQAKKLQKQTRINERLQKSIEDYAIRRSTSKEKKSPQKRTSKSKEKGENINDKRIKEAYLGQTISQKSKEVSQLIE